MFAAEGGKTKPMTVKALADKLSAFQTCWSTYQICSENWIAAVAYLEIIGIIVGQILVGILGDW